MADDGLYAYAITRAGVAERLTCAGIGGRPVHALVEGDLAVVVSPVDLEEFGEEGLRTNLENLDWVRAAAVGHDEVIRAAAALGPVAPMRFATVFETEQSVRRRVGESAAEVEAVLARVEHRSEWSVKAFSEQDASRTTEGDAASGRPQSGREYLARRRRAASDRQAAVHHHIELVEQLHRSLQQVTVASRLLPPQDRQLSGHHGEMLLNATYLVDDGAEDALRATVDGAEPSPGLRYVVDGPWPPYSFADLGQA